jgi:hypothetical protein
MGNDRYFLSFDPCHLQDYTSESTPLQLFVYDRIKERYSILDTTTRGVYLSGDGKYALSPKDKVWHLYHIPSGSKKAIKEKGLGIPWFNDGNAVLFEGEGRCGSMNKAVYHKAVVHDTKPASSMEKGMGSVPKRVALTGIM